jgi:hypothetical protein
MAAIIITIAIFCVLASIAAAIGAFRAMRRDRINFNIVGVTNERRTVEQLCALAAAHQAKADVELEREYDLRTARNRANRERRAAVRSRMQLIHGDMEPEYVLPYPFRRQAN